MIVYPLQLGLKPIVEAKNVASSDPENNALQAQIKAVDVPLRFPDGIDIQIGEFGRPCTSLGALEEISVGFFRKRHVVAIRRWRIAQESILDVFANCGVPPN